MSDNKANNKDQGSIFNESLPDSPLSALRSMPLAVSIVIITRDTKELLKGLLISIEKDVPLKPFIKEVIVVNNASTDETDIMVKEEFPWVMLIENERNMGFAASANQGISRSTGAYILFLNSDTLVIPCEIEKMLKFMDENKDVGICGPQLVYPDMKLQRSFAYIPSLLFEIVPRSFLELIFPKRYLAISYQLSAISSILDVPSLIGAAIMVRREVLETLTGFDERFFFFLEETDLCVRIKGIGHRVAFLPEAKVIHLQGKTVGKKWVKGRIEYNISLHKFIQKHYVAPYSMLFKGVRIFKTFIFLVVVTCLPFLLFHKKTSRSYIYYFTLLLWYLSGCPDKAGLRPIAKSMEQGA
jgi:GT2 family glycosyltransferase